MKTTIGIASLLLFVTTLALGCSREEASQTVERAREAATEAAEVGREAAPDVAAAARETAEAAGEAMEEAAEAAGQAVEEAAEAMAGGMGDPVQTCRDLAAKGAWDQALEPCRKAHETLPDDMAIEHALQQAEAAAAP